MSASDASQTGAARPRLGLWPATALVVGHTIAVGIFLTPAELIGSLASPGLTLGLWVVCGALVLAGATTFGELASRYPMAGGPYIYLREGWGGRIAFLYGWQSLLVMDPGVTAALAAGLSEYAVVLWPATAGAERWLSILVIWILALLSMAGLTLSARVLGAITALKLLAFAAIVVAAFAAPSGSWSHFHPFVERRSPAVPLTEAVALGLIAVFFSFGGFWEASRVAGDVRDARRTVPAALAIGVGAVMAVYVATTAAFIYLVPVQQATSAAAFARRAGEAMLGRSGPSVFAAIVVLSVVASALALLIMAPRVYVAMGRDGLFPARLAAINPSSLAPTRATGLLAILASVYVLVGTFQQIVAFFMCTTLVFIALAASALVVVRRRVPAPAPFQAPGHPLTTMAFVAFVAAIVALVAISRPLQALAGALIVLPGLAAYELLSRRQAEESAPR